MAITKLVAGPEGGAGNSTGAVVASSVNAVIDVVEDAASGNAALKAKADGLDSKIVVVGDTSNATVAEKALDVTGQIKMERVEVNSTETTRPVWFDLNYYIKPASSPVTVTDYHGFDLFGDVSDESYSLPLANAQMYLFESKAFYSGTNFLGSSYAGFLESSNRESGTIGNNVALRLWARNAGSGGINNNYAIRITATQNSGTITNNYGINVGDITGATNPDNNYSIYTGAGKVRFGDSVTSTGDFSSTSTTSKEDVSAGRLMRVGDFGVGTSNQKSGIDLNSVSVTGSFSGDNFTNAPTLDSYYVRTTIHGADYAEQWCTGLTGATKEKIYRRVKDADLWSAWRELALV